MEESEAGERRQSRQGMYGDSLRAAIAMVRGCSVRAEAGAIAGGVARGMWHCGLLCSFASSVCALSSYNLLVAVKPNSSTGI